MHCLKDVLESINVTRLDCVFFFYSKIPLFYRLRKPVLKFQKGHIYEHNFGKVCLCNCSFLVSRLWARLLKLPVILWRTRHEHTCNEITWKSMTWWFRLCTAKQIQYSDVVEKLEKSSELNLILSITLAPTSITQWLLVVLAYLFQFLARRSEHDRRRAAHKLACFSPWKCLSVSSYGSP